MKLKLEQKEKRKRCQNNSGGNYVASKVFEREKERKMRGNQP